MINIMLKDTGMIQWPLKSVPASADIGSSLLTAEQHHTYPKTSQSHFKMREVGVLDAPVKEHIELGMKTTSRLA